MVRMRFPGSEMAYEHAGSPYQPFYKKLQSASPRRATYHLELALLGGAWGQFQAVLRSSSLFVANRQVYLCLLCRRVSALWVKALSTAVHVRGDRQLQLASSRSSPLTPLRTPRPLSEGAHLLHYPLPPPIIAFMLAACARPSKRNSREERAPNGTVAMRQRGCVQPCTTHAQSSALGLT